MTAKNLLTQALVLTLILASSIMGSGVASAMSMVQFTPRQAEQSQETTTGIQKVPETGWELILEEDFSNMTLGTPDEHDDEQLANADYFIPDEYLTVDGEWTGFGLYQSGGACAIDFPSYGGFINTPAYPMQGLVKVSMRVKSLDEIGTAKVMICSGNIANPRIVDKEMSIRQFDIDGWQDYEFYFYNPSTDNVFVQINTLFFRDDKHGIVIDDLKIESNHSYIPAITEASSKDFTNDGFTVSWTGNDDDYIVSLYEEAEKGMENVVIDTDFSAWNLDNNGMLPEVIEGWNVLKMYSNHSPLVEVAGKNMFAFGHHDEILELPSNGGRFTELSFDIVNMKGDNEKAWGTQIKLLGWNGNNWVNILSYSTNGNSDMERSSLNLGKWEDMGPDMYDPTIPAFRGLYSKIRLHCESANYGALMLIDNVHFETTPETETVCIKENEPIHGTYTTYTGLDMNKNYLVGIRINRDGNVSDEMIYEPYGIGSPIAIESTEATSDSFVANWQPVGKASEYLVTAFDCIVAEENIPEYVYHSASLENVVAGTDDYFNPKTIGNNYEYTDLSEYLGEGWLGFGNTLVDGAIGCKGSFMPGMYGILSPELHLGNNDGVYTITAEVWGCEWSSITIGGEKTIIESDMFFEDGWHTITLNIEGGINHDKIAIFSTDGQPFFIRNIKITQNINKGDYILTTVYSQHVSSDANELSIELPEFENGHMRAYDVIAYRKDYTREAVSSSSNVVVVDTPTGIVDTSIDELNISTIIGGIVIYTPLAQIADIYTVDGRKEVSVRCTDGENFISLPATGCYIIKVGNQAKKVIVQ